MTSFADLSDAQMADEITTWAGRVAAGEARLIELIGEFDRREAWAGVGVLSCAHWLSWRLGMGVKAAYERVRVARALGGLPVTRAAFVAGRLSWSQVRAITRVADADDEQTYVHAARHATGAQLERLVRGVRRARKIVEDEADPERAAHARAARVSYDADGMLLLSVRLPATDGAVLLAALDQARAALDTAHRKSSAEEPARPAPARPAPAGPVPVGSVPAGPAPAGPAPAGSATVTDGLLHLARAFLAAIATDRPDLARRGWSRLVALIDPLSGWGRLPDGEFLPPTALTGLVPRSLRGLTRARRLATGRFTATGLAGTRPSSADLSTTDQTGTDQTGTDQTGADQTGADLGRSARLPNLRLRELLGAIDGERCRFPGCTRHRKLHAHHITYWAEGGRTDLNNLALVCGRHHTLIHQQGFRLTLHPDRTLTVTTAAGVPVPHHPDLPWHNATQLDPDSTLTATTLPPTTNGDRLDLGYAVAVLLQQAA